MALVEDFLLDSDQDLQIVDGDILIGASDQQHVEYIMKADRGHFRQYPLIGVGIERNINGPVNVQEIKQRIERQLESDNYNVRKVEVTLAGKISIDAVRLF